MQKNAVEVVGKKSLGAAVLYFIIGLVMTVFAIVLFVLRIPEAIAFGILSMLLAVFLLCMGIRILIIPNDLIAVSEVSVILLKTNQEILFSDIESVLPRRARARNAQYSYGTIVIETSDGQTYEQSLVEEVEDVANILNKKLRQ